MISMEIVLFIGLILSGDNMRINNYGFLFNNAYTFDKNRIFTNMVSTMSGLISDYACIKSGAYNKLVSAYYQKVDPDKRKEYLSYNSTGELVKIYDEESGE